MYHSFLQKLLLVILAGFFTAGAYVWVYKGIVVGAEQAINGGYKPLGKSTPRPTPRRY